MGEPAEEMTKIFSNIFLSAFILFSPWRLGAASPNIVVILADDMGVGDLGCYRSDSKVPTPNLDKFSAEGMRFTNAYCPISVCSPTRYALMTGRYPWHSWKKRGVLANWDEPMIADGVTTLPGLLQSAGYRTGGFGKWHLGARYATTDGKPPKGKGKFKSPGSGENLDLSAQITGGPTDRGFEEWFGFVCASEQLIFNGDKMAAIVGHDLYHPPQAVGIENYPVIPLKEALPHDTVKAIDFLDRQKGGNMPFFLYFAPYVPHIPLAVADSFRGKTKAGEYGDYVHELDHYIGKLLAALERNGQAENTLVIFASDNGSQFPESGEGHRPNAPYQGTKWTIREGGVRTPLLVRWPGVVEPGSASGQLIGLNDILATIAAVVGVGLPVDSDRDSQSFLPVLLGQEKGPVRESIVLCSSGGLHALRRGKWKYVEGPGDGRKRDPSEKGPQLYDLEADPGETKNVAASHLDTVNRMQEELDSLLTTTVP